MRNGRSGATGCLLNGSVIDDMIVTKKMRGISNVHAYIGAVAVTLISRAPSDAPLSFRKTRLDLFAILDRLHCAILLDILALPSEGHYPPSSSPGLFASIAGHGRFGRGGLGIHGFRVIWNVVGGRVRLCSEYGLLRL